MYISINEEEIILPLIHLKFDFLNNILLSILKAKKEFLLIKIFILSNKLISEEN